MFFAAFTSAFVVRRGLSRRLGSHTACRRILWFNTAVLLASSVALELARRALKAGEREQLQPLLDRRHRLSASLFLAGQYAGLAAVERAAGSISRPIRAARSSTC